MNPESNTAQLAERPLQKNDIRTLISSDRVKQQMALALPRHITPDRMSRVALTAITKNPKLLECTPESVLLALMTCSQYGIEPDGRHAHLIPYFDNKAQVTLCQFQWDYKGLVACIRKSPDVRDIYADVICEEDAFSIKRGLARDLVHEIDIRKPRGEVIGAYSVIVFKDGTTSFEVMSREEIDAIRKRSKAQNYGPWVTDYAEMAKKTVIKRHSKLAPLASELAEAMEIDTEITQGPSPIQKPVFAQVVPPEMAALPAHAPERAPEPQTAPVEEAPTPPPKRNMTLRKQTGSAAGPAIAEPPPTQPDPAQTPPKKVPPAPESDRAPGGEPEPAMAAVPAPGQQTVAGRLLALGAKDGYTEADIIYVLIGANLAPTTAKTLADVAENKLQMALDDPETFAGELANKRRADQQKAG